MARACGLDLLLVLLLSMAGTSKPDAVIRLNNALLNHVSDIGKVPLQRALRVKVPDFLDRSGRQLELSRVRVLNVHVPRLRLKFIPAFGLRMMAVANFTLMVSRKQESQKLKMPVILTADAQVTQSSIKTPVVSISSCFSFFDNAIPIDSQDSTKLLQLLQKHIQAVLRNKICLRISNLVQGLNVHLGTLIGLNPVGPESQIHYSMTSPPTITKDYISLDIKTVLLLLGRPIVLPVGATSFKLPEHVGNEGTMTTVGLSQELFDSAFLLLQKAGALNLDITGEMKSHDNMLNTSSLGQLIPEVAHQFPESRPLVLKVRLGATPVASLHPNNATLRLQPTVEVLAVTSNSAFQSLFTLDVVVTLNLQLFVSKVRLQGLTSVLGDAHITVTSSNVGFLDTDHVHTLMDTVFEKPLVDHLNAILDTGIILPRVANLYYTAPQVFVQEGFVVISSGLFYQP